MTSRALVAPYLGIALASVKCVQDSFPSTQSASPATGAPPPRKVILQLPNIILCIAGNLVGINFGSLANLITNS